MINDNLLHYLCCPKCKSDLVKQNNFLICERCGGGYEIINENIIKIIPDLKPDLELSIKKWDEFYQKQLRNRSYIKEKK